MDRDLQEKLLRLRDKIDRAKMEVARLTGKKEELMKELKKRWACESIEEAEKRLDEMIEKGKQIEQEIKRKLEFIREKYPQVWES